MATTFTAVMMGLTGSITARVMTTLGLGFINYEALKTIAEQLKTALLASYAAVDVDILNVLNLAGVGEYLNIVLAAIITKAGLMAIKRIGVIPTS
jgi:hypothetical protein